MRVVELDADRHLVIANRSPDEVGAGQVRVAVSYCGICGSDLHMRSQPEVVPAGGVLGHEFAGRIAETGLGVDEWRPGDLVAIVPYDSCGACDPCRVGQENQCVTWGVSRGAGIHGVHLQGGFAESVVTNTSRLRPLPEGTDERHAAMMEPLAVACRAVARASIDPGDAALVIGGGPIGLLVALVLRERGHESLALLDRNPARARTAAGLGLTAITEATAPSVRAALGGRQPDVVFDCSGSPAATHFATDVLRIQGLLVLVGLALEPVRIEPDIVVIREIDIRGSAGAARADFDASLDLIGRGALPLDAMISGVVPLAETESAFDALTDPATTHVKILVQPTR